MTSLSSIRIAAVAAVLPLAAAPALAQAVDHLGVPGPIALGGQSYALAWSSQPSPDYTKQEYVPVGQTVEALLHLFGAGHGGIGGLRGQAGERAAQEDGSQKGTQQE